MNFIDLPKDRTQIELSSFPFSINYQTAMFFLGSCFSENIGNQLEYFKFPVLINPLGTIYNPVSVLNTLQIISKKGLFSKKDLTFSDGKYFHYSFNTLFSGSNSESTVEKMNTDVQSSHNFFKKTEIIFITLGTSFAYQLKVSGKIVSNCHKQPASLFDRILLDTGIIKNALESILKITGENKKVVFTVSPIRHLKDGLIENQRSKAQLISIVHQVIENHPNTFYFPAYEIMMDDLRDYRYYDESLTHLSNAAIQYIFHHFAKSMIDKTVFPAMQDIDKFKKMIQHKTTYHSDMELSDWKNKLNDSINRLAKKYPFLDFAKERAAVLSKI
ncbi:MAG: GSCFA domain-containing protein [Bacteroidales bacterium]|nr:GSCFA domain-containing protein [Bacteroidales bacterium]